MSTSREIKRAWRDQWKKFPSPPPEERAENSKRLLANVLLRPELEKARRIAIFAARDWEPDLGEVWRRYPDRACFPRVEDRLLKFYTAKSPDDLTPGFAGILEPAGSKPIVFHKGDIILVPALAWDNRGFRLGSGLGLYDKLLESLSSGVLRWGVGFSNRFLSEPLPVEPFDQSVPLIFTELGVLRAAS